MSPRGDLTSKKNTCLKLWAQSNTNMTCH